MSPSNDQTLQVAQQLVFVVVEVLKISPRRERLPFFRKKGQCRGGACRGGQHLYCWRTRRMIAILVMGKNQRRTHLLNFGQCNAALIRFLQEISLHYYCEYYISIACVDK